MSWTDGLSLGDELRVKRLPMLHPETAEKHGYAVAIVCRELGEHLLVTPGYSEYIPVPGFHVATDSGYVRLMLTKLQAVELRDRLIEETR